MSEQTGLRMELRDSVIMNSAGDPTHYPELHFGLGFGFGGVVERAPTPALPADSDADGIDDSYDACPNEAAATADGCPIRDSDKDGVADGADRCPEVAGTTADGCLNPDPDQDGVPASRDRCPDVSGVEPDGCPNLDADKDGVNLPNDLCPDQPETVNGFEDEDGCPDQMPEKLKQFSGVIQGVEFDFGKASIRAKSFPVLDAAAAALKEYKSLRVRVTGHTDSVGAHDVNLERSRERAEAVKDYLVKQGVEAARIETRGAGPDEPLEDNKTEAGRQKNRRIEFAIIKQ